MKQEIINIFKSTVLSQVHLGKPLGYCFSCSFNYYNHLISHTPLNYDCKGSRDKNSCKNWFNQSKIIAHLNIHSDQEILGYINMLIGKKLSKHILPNDIEKLLINQFKLKLSFSCDKRLSEPLYINEKPFKKTIIDVNIDGIKPSDLPFLNQSDFKNAKFFASLYYLFYHIEVGLRNYLRQRLKSIFKESWESELQKSGLFNIPFSLREQVNLTNNYPKRGNDILNYCNWNDYPKIIDIHKDLWENNNLDKNEFNAHISSMYKIRNAIAHNAETIDKNILLEMEVFLKKYKTSLE